MKAIAVALVTLLILLPWPANSKNAHASAPEYRGTVVVIHGLARSPRSMSKMARSLEEAGYRVCNVSYPSRQHAIVELAGDHVAPAVKACVSDEKAPIHFVTHSLGGIIVRQLAASGAGFNIGRVVMLSPPNQGSEVVDKLGNLRAFKLANGPAGLQLGTEQNSVPRSLGPASFELGVITGRRSVNPILSWMIPGRDDGKVSVENAKLDGMRDFLVLPASHTFIMNDRRAIEQTIHFLTDGAFN